MERYNCLKDIHFLKRYPPEVLFRHEENDGKPLYILFNSLNQEAYALKEANKLVWDMLDGTASVEVIVNRIYAHYIEQVEKSELILDVIEFLKFLWENDFIFKAFRETDHIEIKELDCYG